MRNPCAFFGLKPTYETAVSGASPLKRIASILLASTLLAAAGCSSGNVYSTTVQSPVATLSTTALSFGTIPLGQTSAAQSVTLTNTGTGAALSVGPLAATGTNPTAFLTSSNCPTVLTKGSGCTLTIVYSPTASGAQSATVKVTDNASNSPQVISLTGTGSSSGPVLSLSSTSLSFASLPVGQAATQTVTLSNIGSGTLALAGFTVTGANATSFAVSGSCLTTGTVAAGGSCFLTVTYAPTVTGSLSAMINVNDNAPNTPQTITLASR